MKYISRVRSKCKQKCLLRCPNSNKLCRIGHKKIYSVSSHQLCRMCGLCNCAKKFAEGEWVVGPTGQLQLPGDGGIPASLHTQHQGQVQFSID